MIEVLNKSIFDVKCNLLIIPISTTGTISNSFKTEIEKLGIANELWENRKYKLGDVKILPRQSQNRYIAFACTVDQYNSAYYAIRQIGKSLAQKITELDSIREISTPILGTGAGKLTSHLSLHILYSAFYENKKTKKVKLFFCVPDSENYHFIKAQKNEKESISAQLVIKAEIPNIRKNEFIRKILYEKEFYFELAVEKFNEFVNYRTTRNNFYEELLKKFKSSKLTFKEFINSNLSNEQYDFTKLCGELIAHIDVNAYHKNIWNEYPDKRVLAKAAVRQNDWFSNLIKFKLTNDLSSVSSSIHNALAYLKSPDNNLTMLSENHRKKVMENVFPYAAPEENIEKVLLSFFSELGVKPQNQKNFGVICSRILYLPFIKPVWSQSLTSDVFLGRSKVYTDLSKVSTLIEKCLKEKSKILDIGNCGINDLSIIPELFECIHIEKLILSNEWAEYKDGKWIKLTSKNKGKKNNIQVIPDAISQLSELKILICGGDWNEYKHTEWNRWGIKSLNSIVKLKNLEYLNLSNNALTSIKGLSKLTNLKIAHFNNNIISRVEDLDNLNHLTELYLSNNKLNKTGFVSKLSNIETLDLHNNFIKDLRPIKSIIKNIGIKNDKWEVNTLNIAKNPLEYPPMEIINLGTDEVLGVLDDIKKRGRYVNRDIKVILVGNSEVGKSTLVKYLDNENGLEEEHYPTLWMEEKIIKSKYSVPAIGEECLLHIFDFGGHDYYHDTHHLFYSTNTIYLLLWDKETNKLNSRRTIQRTKEKREIEIETQDYPIRYWLDSIKFHIKDIEADNFEFEIKREITYDSQLLLIQNKVDDASKIVFQDNKKLKKNNSFIYDIINLSLKPQRGLNHFDNLFTEMLSKMNIIGATLPKFYEPIKKSFNNYEREPILSFSEFKNYCNEILDNPIDSEQTRRLIKYLDQLGLILYTNKDNEERIYADKKWIVQNMHKVLENLIEKNGEFKKDYVEKKLGFNDDKQVDNLLSMMEEFKIIFKHPYLDTYIAPLYLPKIPDGKVNLFLNKRQVPLRRFEFTGFIHKNVVLGIFQKFGTLFSLENGKDIFYYWRDGLIIKNPNTEEIAMIKFNLGNEEGNAFIDVFDLTQESNPIFIYDVLQFIRDVNKGYELEEMVTLDGIDYISVGLLEDNAKLGKYIFSEKKLSEPRKNEKEKLFKLKDYMKFIDTPVKKKKVVISYSKKDITHIHTLKRYLKPLVDAELIEDPWYCTNLKPGDDWNNKIKYKFDEADIVFFMVSEYFYSTAYIIDNEIKNAIDRYEKGENIKIIPIILEFYDWGRKEPYNLQRFSALPYQAKPISDFRNPNMAWNTITASVKMMIEKDLDPAKIDLISRDLEEIYERQVKGKLDNNS